MKPSFIFALALTNASAIHALSMPSPKAALVASRSYETSVGGADKEAPPPLFSKRMSLAEESTAEIGGQVTTLVTRGIRVSSRGGKGGGKRNGKGYKERSKDDPDWNSEHADSWLGGQTETGSGETPRFANNKYYPGGATIPYPSCNDSTTHAHIPFFVHGHPLDDQIFPGEWDTGACGYDFNKTYTFLDRSQTNATNPEGTEMTLPVWCLCRGRRVCGCEENTDPAYLADLFGDGHPENWNKTLVRVSVLEPFGQMFLVINGTLQFGTTAAHGQKGAAVRNGVFGGAAGLMVAFTLISALLL